MTTYATPDGHPRRTPTTDPGPAPVPDLSGLDEADPLVVEWLLSDHPWARIERQRRREQRTARDIADADAAGFTDTAMRLAVNGAEPDSNHVARQRRWLETIRQVDDPRYVYPAALLGPTASRWAPPGSPPMEGFEFGGWNHPPQS